MKLENDEMQSRIRAEFEREIGEAKAKYQLKIKELRK